MTSINQREVSEKIRSFIAEKHECEIINIEFQNDNFYGGPTHRLDIYFI